jgi:hypothetical protein
MTNKEFEEKIYEFGNIMYRIGRMETDDKAGMKEYNKLIKQKEEYMEIFNSYFKSSIKVAKSLGVVC